MILHTTNSAGRRLLSLGALTLALGAMADASLAGTRFSGTFTADKACEAYTNKPEKPGSEKKNPDGAKLEVGEVYPVLDANKPAGPTWYRLDVADANPSQRWVDASCGTAQVKTESVDTNKPAVDCKKPGQADSYVFAVSWQAAFCETHMAKPECASATPSSWAAGHFTLHGLWPNLNACGTNYGFCSSQAKAAAFCDYPEPAIQGATLDKLKVAMPSAGAGSCLQRHEWYKHGTCQTEWNADGYFDVALQLADQFNKSGAADYMGQHLGQMVAADEFFAVIDKGLGAGAHERMKFTCQLLKEGDKSVFALVDIYMNLPAVIPAKPDLKQLLQAGKPGFYSNCGSSFRVEAIPGK